jgi:3-dehydroquinate synthase
MCAKTSKVGLNLVFTNSVGRKLDDAVEKMNPSSVHVLVDVNTEAFVLPLLQAESKAVADAKIIRIKAGESFKNIDSMTWIWRQLDEQDANRNSLLINIGGGVVTDMGGFAAGTFKRGIRFINVPTTLLAAVDASVGGKTGINFNGLKNEIGMFRDADLVIISTIFFRTLTSQELLSGYAEMLKHGLVWSRDLTNRMLVYDVTNYDSDSLLKLLEESVAVKQHYVEADHDDRGARRALNLGHTIGHAFESLALKRGYPLGHGYAVAFGMVGALVLSRMKFNFPSDLLHTYAEFVRHHYGAFEVTCDDYKHLLTLMHHDKKNDRADVINCTLLRNPGEVEVNSPVTDDDLTASLDIYRDLLRLP